MGQDTGFSSLLVCLLIQPHLSLFTDVAQRTRILLCGKAKRRRWQALSQPEVCLHLGTKSNMITIVSKSIYRGSPEPGNRDYHLCYYSFVKKGRNRHGYLAN